MFLTELIYFLKVLIRMKKLYFSITANQLEKNSIIINLLLLNSFIYIEPFSPLLWLRN